MSAETELTIVSYKDSELNLQLKREDKFISILNNDVPLYVNTTWYHWLAFHEVFADNKLSVGL